MFCSSFFQADELKAKINTNGDLVIFNNTVPGKDFAIMDKENVVILYKWLKYVFEKEGMKYD